MKKLLLKIKSILFFWSLKNMSSENIDNLLNKYIDELSVDKKLYLYNSYIEKINDYMNNELWFKLFSNDDNVWNIEEYKNYNREILRRLDENKKIIMIV